MGKNRQDECMIISYTKEQSKKKPGFGHSRLARRPAAGLMKHLWRGTFASATKKMCSGSADVPGPPEQNNDIITISVTDQTVHKVTGEGGPVTHTHREDCPRPEAWDAGRMGLKSEGEADPHAGCVFLIQSQLFLLGQKSEKPKRNRDWSENSE